MDILGRTSRYVGIHLFFTFILKEDHPYRSIMGACNFHSARPSFPLLLYFYDVEKMKFQYTMSSTNRLRALYLE